MTERTAQEALIHFHPIYENISCKPESGFLATNEKDINCPECLKRLADSKRITVIFPKLKFVNENSLYEQLAYIQLELNEVYRAYGEPGYERISEELVDTMQSCATALYMIQKHHGLGPDEAVRQVVRKNKDRGYEL